MGTTEFNVLLIVWTKATGVTDLDVNIVSIAPLFVVDGLIIFFFFLFNAPIQYIFLFLILQNNDRN